MIKTAILGLILLTSSAMAWTTPHVKKTTPVRAIPASDSESPCSTSSLRVLGVCGGIGSGKSHACRLLVSSVQDCVAHLEADSIAHAVYHPDSEAVKEIANEFGSDILQENGEIDRPKLGQIVFAEPQAMAKLERIVWPHVKQEIQERLDVLRLEHDEGGVVILEAAVLLDAGWEDILDGVWVVTAPSSVALARLVSERGFTEEEAQKRIEAQKPRRGIGNLDEEVEKGVVTKVIENTGSSEELKDALHRALEDPAAWKSPTSMESTS